MYLPQPFEEIRLNVLHGLVRAHPLGTLVTVAGDQLCADHIPFLLDAGRGEKGELHAHVSKANPLWRHFAGALQALVIFQGPESYITPSWYPRNQSDGKVVPTWNYAVVHAYGVPRAVTDSNWLLEHVTQLTRTHEAQHESPWQVSDAPKEYVQRMIGGIVGITMPISRLEGKWKVSQNRERSDQLGVVAGLRGQATDRSRSMAELVASRTQP